MLHHYTSIENLALILSTKRFRFTRLDLVDDVHEIHGMPREFGTYVFISCWTNDDEENIALWKMYSGNMRGVRISFPDYFFIQEKVYAGDYDGYEFTLDFVSPLRFEDLRTEESVILNNFNDPNSFYKEVIYDDGYRNHYQAITTDDGKNFMTKLHELGRYKAKRWEFQRECRFTIYRLPLLPLSHPDVNYDLREQAELSTRIIHENIPNTVKYIDLEIDDVSYNNIQIRLGPLSTASDKIIVESLLSRYTSNYSLEDSALKGSIRK